MFGYLQIQKSELLVKEFEIYKAVYCSLCRTLGKDFSFFCRVLLSYDFTFYTLLLMALDREKCNGFKKGRCCCNPFKSCNYCVDDSQALHTAAALTVSSAYYKLCDDIQDSKLLKSVICRFLRMVLSRYRKKAKESYPQFDTFLSEMMKKQNKVESSDSYSIDESCEPTAEMLAGIFSMFAKNETENRILSEMGYHIGRWIYLADAAHDLEKDIAKHEFNCLIPLYERCSNLEDFNSECNSLMNMAISNSFRAFELLDINKYYGILHNHFVYGMPSMQRKILCKGKGKEMKKNE